MAYGILGFSAPGGLSQPSPSIWGDCSSYEILDEGKGYFSYQEFFDTQSYVTATGSVITATGLPQASFGHVLTGAVQLRDGNFNHAMKFTIGANAADGLALYDQPQAYLQSGKKFWFETSVAFGAVSGALQGGFFGFVAGPSNQNVAGTITAQAGGTPAALTQGAVDAKAGVLAVPSATRASNTISTTSLFGFLVTPTGAQATDGLKVDIIRMSQPTFSATPTALPAVTSTSTAVGTPVYIALDVLNAASITANLPAGQTTEGLIPGDIKAYAQGTGSTVAAFNAAAAYNFGFLKFGIRWDGSSIGGIGLLHFYVNGVEVARAQVDTTFDVQSPYAPIVNFTGAASGVFYVDFFRAASFDGTL